MIPLSHSLIFGCTLFIIGLLGVLTRRNLLFTSYSLIIINASLSYVLYCVGLFDNPEDGSLNLMIISVAFLVQLLLTSNLIILQYFLNTTKQNKQSKRL